MAATLTRPRTWLMAALVCMAAYLLSIWIGGWSVAAEAPPDAVSFQYRLSRGTEEVTLRECVGLGTASEVTEVRDGSTPGDIHLIPGRVRQIRVTCQRGVTGDLTLANWRAQVLTDFSAASSQVDVRLLDTSGAPVARWRLQNAWPEEVTVGLGTETVSLVAEALTRVP